MSDDDDIYTLRRLRKHAKAQAASVARRKAKDAPARDDLGRAAYYTLLAMYRDPEVAPAVRASIQKQVMALMHRAGFDLIEANSAFLKDATGFRMSLKGWLFRRKLERERRLKAISG